MAPSTSRSSSESNVRKKSKDEKKNGSWQEEYQVGPLCLFLIKSPRSDYRAARPGEALSRVFPALSSHSPEAVSVLLIPVYHPGYIPGPEIGTASS